VAAPGAERTWGNGRVCDIAPPPALRGGRSIESADCRTASRKSFPATCFCRIPLSVAGVSLIAKPHFRLALGSEGYLVDRVLGFIPLRRC
jgi:hypothetical protein